MNRVLAGLVPSAVDATVPKKRKMSAAVRAVISAAAKARWAKVRAKKSVVELATKKERKMSATAKAKLSAIAKARWTKARKAGKSRL